MTTRNLSLIQFSISGLIKFKNMFKYLIFNLFLFLITISCSMTNVKLIYVDEVLKDLDDTNSPNQLEFNLEDCLYLDKSLKYSIDSIIPSFFADRQLDLSKYEFDSKHGDRISLTSKYESVGDVIINADTNLKKYLYGSLFESEGENYNEEIDIALIYKEKAFIRLSNEFSTTGYVIELIKPDSIVVSRTFVIVD